MTNMRLVFAIVAAYFCLVAPGSASAAVFVWQGQCTLGCTGNANGVLNLADGVSPLNFNSGGGFPNADFISFEYTSSSGSFFLNNTSPYLYAMGYGSGVLLEENGQGPNTLPLQQFSYNTAAIPTLTLAPEAGAWQFLFGSYAYTCLDPQCAAWTNDVIRNVGVMGEFTPAAAVPEPATWLMMLLGFVGLALLTRQRRRADAYEVGSL